jgi:hypothetical protein
MGALQQDGVKVYVLMYCKVVWLEVNALYALKSRVFGEEVGKNEEVRNRGHPPLRPLIISNSTSVRSPSLQQSKPSL